MTIHIGYSTEYLGWRGSHASPQRARLAVEHILAHADDDAVEVNIVTPKANKGTIKALYETHDRKYVDRVLAGSSDEWQGKSATQGHIASVMFEGTRVLVNQIVNDKFATGVYFNPQGAKHHAQYAQSSGFCVFNDMAWAATRFTRMGKRVAYLDWDAHHGDGVEALTKGNSKILTASIHEWGIFPNTGLKSQPRSNVYNYPMESGDGDIELFEAVDDALKRIHEFQPDVLLLAIGADGLANDPLAHLKYTVRGLVVVSDKVANLAKDLNIPILVGGAGGYQPYTEVPVAWAECVWTMHEALKETPEAPEWWVTPADEGDESEDGGSGELTHSQKKALLLEALKEVPATEWEDILSSDEIALVDRELNEALQELQS